MPDRPGTCEYVLDPYDPSTWGGTEGDWCYVEDDLNENGLWPCPHDASEGEDRCIFHRSPAAKDDEDVVAAVLDALDRADEIEETEHGRECQQFIGARFGSFVVRNRTLDGDADAPLDLRHARFEGVLDGEATTLGSQLRLDGAVIPGGAFLRGAELDGGVSCRGVTVENGIDASGTTIGDDADFRGATIVDGLHLRGSTVTGDVGLGAVTIDGETDLEDAEIDGEIDLTDAHLAGGFSVRETSIGGGIDCRGTSVEGELDFRGATVSGAIDFHGVDLEGARLCDATLRNADLREADLTDADGRGADLRGANLERSTLSRASLFGADLRGAAMYGAVVGDAGIDGETSFGDRCPYDPAYEGETGLAPDTGREPGSAVAAGADDDSVGSLRKAAGAYRLVEELARANALPGLVAHSFVRRQDVHRRRCYETGAYGRWLGQWTSRLVVLYGESWKRLVATGALVVFGFAVLYPVGGWLDPTDGPPLTYGRIAADPFAFGEGLYFSAVTFVSLGIGDVHPIGVGRILAAIEALVGATLLVLLVYVFARRGTR